MRRRYGWEGDHKIIKCPSSYLTGLSDKGRDDEDDAVIAVDGKQVCRLVKTLEDIEELLAVVFVFTDRFDMLQRIWYERIHEIFICGGSENIILLHNKLGRDQNDLDENLSALKKMLNRHKDEPNLNYMQLSFDMCPNFEFQKAGLLTKLKSFSPVRLESLVIPQLCYKQKEISGEPFEREISRRQVFKLYKYGIYVFEFSIQLLTSF